VKVACRCDATDVRSQVQPAVKVNAKVTYAIDSQSVPLPLYQLGGLGSAVSSCSGVWGEAPATERFGAYLSQTEWL